MWQVIRLWLLALALLDDDGMDYDYLPAMAQ